MRKGVHVSGGGRRRVAVLVDPAGHYGRTALLGMARFKRQLPQWEFHVHPRWPLVWDRSPRTAIDGLIAQATTAEMAASIGLLDCPIVNISSLRLDQRFPSVIADSLRAGESAARYFLSRHHRHFAYVSFPGHYYAVRTGVGFATALRRAGRRCRVFRPRGGASDEYAWQQERARLRQFLRRLPRPAAVLACNDVRGRHVLEAAREAGIAVPDDLAVLSAGNDQLTCLFVQPQLSSIEVNAEEIGYQAALMLNRIMTGHAAPRAPLLVPPSHVVSRQSSDSLAVDDPEVAAVVRYIRRHAVGQLRVADILREFPTSRRSLERRFIATIGHAPGEEIRRVRVELARQLLAETELPLWKVAAQAGFSSPARLNEAFRRELQMPPSDYRKRTTGN